MAMKETSPAPLTAVRFKLAVDQPTPQPDPLGRERIGYRPGLSTAELWERGRGVWKAKLVSVAECDLVIIAHEGIVVLVGSVDGVTFAGDRIAVMGTPDPTHPLIGQPDPLHNGSQNPVAYGEIQSVPPSSTQRSCDAVLADAIAVLTEAARLRRPTYRQTANGEWEPDSSHTEPIDWPEFVTLALAGAAANMGHVWNVLRGRPGSWEAAGVGSLLDSTVGPDGDDLWRHRTEPIRIDVAVAAVLVEFFDDPGWLLEAEDHLEQQADAEYEAAGTITDDMLWWYAFPESGDPEPLDPDAPAWSWESYRRMLTDAGQTPTEIARYEQQLRSPESIAAGFNRVGLDRDEAKDAIAAIEARQAEISDKYAILRENLMTRRQQLWAEFAANLRSNLEVEIAALDGLNVPVEITIDAATEDHSRLPTPDTIEWALLERAATAVEPPTSAS